MNRNLRRSARGIHPIFGIIALVVLVAYIVLLVLFPALILAVTLLLLGLVVLGVSVRYGGTPQEKTTIAVVAIVMIIAGIILGFLGTLNAESLSLVGGL
jgi:hypothetical protein